MAVPETTDPTFRAYNSSQAKQYDEGRPSYAPALYQAILRHHDATGGRRDVVVDVGCGPGRATRDLARFFDRAIGLDPGSNMIETARMLGGETQGGKDILYCIAAAETIADVEQVPAGQVDLLTAAAAVSITLELNESSYRPVLCLKMYVTDPGLMLLRPIGSICPHFGHRRSGSCGRVEQWPCGRLVVSIVVRVAPYLEDLDAFEGTLTAE